MADSAEPLTHRYSAFISYSHADAKAVRKLHRQLETYRLPAQLAGAKGHGARRLKPVFRDSDEMSAAHDLTEAIREALAQADYLIVICSPDAAKSQWVGREIEVFRALHGDRRILAALMSGDPETSFPPALRHGAHDSAIEPLAADFRPGASGGRMAMLRLVAPMAGVHLDDLVHRDAQRQLRRFSLVSAGTVVTIAIVALLAMLALNARTDAALQARRANGLGDFMLSDLRKGLEAAGRHDLLREVNRATLEADVDVSKMTPEQRIQRAAALQNVAKDAEKAGDLSSARAKVDEAYKITAALLSAKPNDPKRLFAHAQSEYWVGFVSWREGNGAAAKAGFESYARLANHLSTTDPKNDDWRMEKVYASNNLGMLVLRHAKDAVGAEPYFRKSLEELATITTHRPNNFDALFDRTNALGWLADCQRLQHRLRDASATRETQKNVLVGILAKNPRHHEVQSKLLGYQLAAARIAAEMGDEGRALSLLESGRQKALAMAEDDPDNKDLGKQARMFELFKARAWLDRPKRNQPSSAEIATVLGDCASLGPGSVNQEISDLCGVLLARLRMQEGDQAGAVAALAPVQGRTANNHDVLTARWGLDLAAEARPVQLAIGVTK